MVSPLQSCVHTDLLAQTVERLFPNVLPATTWGDSACIIDFLDLLSQRTDVPVATLFAVLVGDKKAEAEIGFPVVVVDPTALHLPQRVRFPRDAASLFLPLALSDTTLTCACSVPLLVPTDAMIQQMCAAAGVEDLAVVFSPPGLFAASKESLDGLVIYADEADIAADTQGRLTAQPGLDLKGFSSPSALNGIFPTALQRRYGAVPVFQSERKLTLAAASYPDVFKRSAISTSLGTPFDLGFVLAAADAISAAIEANALQGLSSAPSFGHVQGTAAAIESDAACRSLTIDLARLQKARAGDSGDAEATTSILPVLEDLLVWGISHKGSDLHLTPYENHLEVEVTVDGWKIQYPSTIEKRFAAPLIRALKVLSDIDIQRLNIAHYGKFSLEVGDSSIEIRTTIMPTVWGDSATLRFAPVTSNIPSLEQIGMGEHEKRIIKKVIDGRFGLLLVCGPTGSGKSTTLYSTMASIDTRKYKVDSGEDPVERLIPGIKQVPINRDFTFAKYVEATLRDAVDYINVGETMNPETAAQIIRAAETGHICFTTLHTAYAAMAPNRMYGFGITPFVLSETLTAVIAQQLAPKLCPRCSLSVAPPTPQDLRALGVEPTWMDGIAPNFRQGKGCRHCMHRGFSGMKLLAEGYYVDAHIRALIASRSASADIRTAQIAQGGKPLLRQAWEAAAAGIISLSTAMDFSEQDKALAHSTDTYA